MLWRENMVNVLVVEDNFYQSKQIVNYILKRNEDIKLYALTYSGKEALEIIQEQKVDIILLDLKLKEMDGTVIIKEIENQKISKYKSSIIIISGEYSLISQICNSEYVYKCFSKPFDFKELEKSIKDMVHEHKNGKHNKIKFKIDEELKKLNFNFSYRGTRYLSECIYNMYISNESDTNHLAKNVYAILAKKYHQSPNTIYGNIKQAINIMFVDCEEKVLKDYFNYSFIVKPKPKEIIYVILSKLYN